ncbi:hypothetical protein O0L34_g5028 [Tuta absoluta]|nr:hypothetical protein O0L34_g5028 [Tuta absoluta]
MVSRDTDEAQSACACTAGTLPPSPALTADCQCPRDELNIAIHDETCLLYKNERIIHPHTPEECECYDEYTEVCKCCQCVPGQCRCRKAGREAFDEWRRNRDIGTTPHVLESTHPLMQKFQQSLRRFLEKENELAEQEIIALQDELKASKEKYDKDLEGIYRSDHDTNGQRMLIQEYEEALAKERKTREEAEQRSRINAEKYKECKEKLDADMMCNKDSTIELQALTQLVQQLETWREETESDLTVSQRMTEKMKQDKRAMAEEKRQLDMLIYGLNNEIWKLEAKMELYKKQMEIKNVEMDKVVDKVTAYSTELEDLELDKKRLISLWNSVLVNIKQRDKVFDSVREDYKALQENYRTLMSNLEITKRMSTDEMQKSKVMAMERDKIDYDINIISNLYEAEDKKRVDMEKQIEDLQQSMEMTDRDIEMTKMENATMRNILTSTEKECDRLNAQKLKMENKILENLQDCLLNDKAVEAMAKGIKNMRDMARKLEISLMELENQHAKVMLDIEIRKDRQSRQAALLEKSLAKVREREQELVALQDQYDDKQLVMTRKQRELDIVQKKFNALNEIFNQQSPQERRIIQLEQQIKALRDRTENMQYEWLRLQGHVVRLTQQHQHLVADIGLIHKQIQICDQKLMFTTANIEKVTQERIKVDRLLRDLRGRLTVLERARKETKDITTSTQKANQALSLEYSSNLKEGEGELLDLEEEIEVLEKDKVDLTQQLDHVTREALVWQRKGILAVELRRNFKAAQSTVGEIGRMKNEIHRMEVRREQLRRTEEKLSDDLALYVMRRETATDKTRASAAAEKARGAHGNTSQSSYKHKLRLVKSDVTRVTKELTESKAQMKQWLEDQDRLNKEVDAIASENAQLEENIATLLRECRQVDKDKQWLLERVVRSQRVGSELQRAVKRQSLHIRKPKSTVLAEYEQSRALNDRLQYIVNQLTHDFPYLEEKLDVISNTLNILTPTTSPRLTEDAPCELRAELGAAGCVIPEEPEMPPEPPKLYCWHELDKETCIHCKCDDTD